MNKLLPLFVLSTCSAFAAAQVQFNVIDLGPVGMDTFAYAVNDSGAVAGSRIVIPSYVSGYSDAVRWSPEMHSLGLTTGSASGSRASAINSAGVIAGTRRTSTHPNSTAYTWDNGVVTDLGTLGGSGSYAWGINSSGWVVGAAYASYGSLPKPFLYRDGQMEDLLPNYGDAMFGEAQAINSSGAVVGFRNASYGDRATLWQNGQVVDLGWGYATAINDLGQIVGYVGTNANAQALLFQNGSAVNLGSLGGAVTRAFGINNSGWVVGMGWNSSQESRAFIYRQGTLTNLNSLIAPEQGWTLHEARGVNASGQIVGWGTRAGDHYAHAFLLNPVTEPGSLAGLTLGFLLMKRFSRRRR